MRERPTGALYLTTCGKTVIDTCTFTTNTARKHQTHTSSAPYGGAICAKNLSRLEITDSHFAGNGSVGLNGIGGAVYVPKKTSYGLYGRKRSSSVTTDWTRPECALRTRPPAETIVR